MFNIGPAEFLVLAIVAVIVLGPDRIPGLARDAARMIRTLRDLATGARAQLRDELGPEFADLDLRTLNPRVALQRAILGDEESGLKADLRKLDPREDVRESLRGTDPRRYMDDRYMNDLDDTGPRADDPAISLAKPASSPAPAEAQRPLARGETAPYDHDAT